MRKKSFKSSKSACSLNTIFYNAYTVLLLMNHSTVARLHKIGLRYGKIPIAVLNAFNFFTAVKNITVNYLALYVIINVIIVLFVQKTVEG